MQRLQMPAKIVRPKSDAPPTVNLQMRVPVEFLERVDEWRRRQPDLPSRQIAIRRMVELILDRSDIEAKFSEKYGGPDPID
jgi:hypothetical protein